MYRASPQDGIAWVTGASSGIGRSVALELAIRGWRVAVTARRAPELDALAAEPAASGRIFPFPGDVTDRPGLNAIVNRLERDCGPIALAFLNAGGFLSDPPRTIGDGYRATFALNVEGTLNALEPLLGPMLDRGRGQIVVTSSLAGYGGLPGAGAYSASKAALIALCESLRLDLARRNITVQVLNPGFIKTPLTAGNDYPMPLLMDLPEATRRICAGMENGGFEIAFPRRLSYLLKLLNMLPYSIYFALFGRAGGRPG